MPCHAEPPWRMHACVQSRWLRARELMHLSMLAQWQHRCSTVSVVQSPRFTSFFDTITHHEGVAVALDPVQANNKTYCGAEVILSDSNATVTGNGTLVPVAEYADRLPGSSADWFRMTIPLAVFACDQGSVGNLTGVDRVDFQNVNIRDADICLDNIQLV